MEWKPLNKRVLVKLLRTDSLLDLRAADEQAKYTGEGLVLEKADDVVGVEVGDRVVLPTHVTSNKALLGDDVALLFFAELLAVRKKD